MPCLTGSTKRSRSSAGPPLSPDDAPIHANLALAQERKGNRREAALHYREACCDLIHGTSRRNRD